MTRSFLHNPEELSEAVEPVADKTGIPAAYIEKDFWITEILRAVATYGAERSVLPVFKGGTSLSKAYRLAQRFSEDVDLLIITTGESRGSVDRNLKGIVSAVDAALGIAGVLEAGSATKGVKRTVNYAYPVKHGDLNLHAGVRLELRTKGGALPTELMSIRSLIAEHWSSIDADGDFDEAGVFDFRVLGSVLTLVEKLMILHHAAISGEEHDQSRHARHYYDIWCMLNNEATTNDFETAWPCAALAESVELHAEATGQQITPRPTRGFSESPAFVSPSKEMEEAYDQVAEKLLWPDAYKPTFDECCEAVTRNAAVL